MIVSITQNVIRYQTIDIAESMYETKALLITIITQR